MQTHKNAESYATQKKPKTQLLVVVNAAARKPKSGIGSKRNAKCVNVKRGKRGIRLRLAIVVGRNRCGVSPIIAVLVNLSVRVKELKRKPKGATGHALSYLALKAKYATGILGDIVVGQVSFGTLRRNGVWVNRNVERNGRKKI